jgi:peptide-methionine (S)-S-oxide reductase
MIHLPTLFRSASRGFVIALGVAAVGAAALATVSRAAEEGIALPAPVLDPKPATPGPQTAVLAGGCFWGIQGVFQHVQGVSAVLSGYAGGHVVNPTYEEVGTETTGHAETVRITYDPATVSYGTLLQVFFSVGHDPTQLDRQGPDSGESYRSNIFYTTDDQKAVATAYIAQLTKATVFKKKIVTRVDRFTNFYPAEDYHQDFLVLNPNYPYIVAYDLPKIANLKRVMPAVYREVVVRVPAKSGKGASK